MADEAATDKEISVEAAAQQLDHSIAHLLELLAAGAIPFHMVADERRLSVADVEAFRERRARSTDAVSQISKIVEESPAGWDH